MLALSLLSLSLTFTSAFAVDAGAGADAPPAAPGTILSYTNPKFTGFKYYKNSWQLNVSSQDTFGNYNTIVTSIIEPVNANASRVVSYQVPEDAANIKCAPSLNLVNNSFAPVSDINLLLSKGYYVVLPDYEGPKLTFLAGTQSGQAVLNSVRAVLQSGNFTGIDSNADVALWGFSGGSFASGWAATLHPTYAPELRLVGAAVGGFVTDLRSVIKKLDGTAFTGLIATGIGGLMNEYPEFEGYLKNNSDYKKFSEFTQYCGLETVIKLPFTNFFSGFFKVFPKGWQVADTEPAKSIIASNSLVKQNADVIPQIPMFIYHGSLDQIIPTQNSKDIYSKWCNGKIASLEFAEDMTAGHIKTGIVSSPAAITWITNRFKGLSSVNGCTHQKRLSNLFYPGIDPIVSEAVKNRLDKNFGNLGEGIKLDKPSLEDLQKYANSGDTIF